ncbi:plasmid mobilization relaxosome protein MobC [Actinomadura sp. 21ATH]|uniref:plasmid mobilization protein n=1 Tax=Actinomadura sp. 21ATH TaxID=1735444 RepID=UPI0035C11C3F
MVERRDRRGRTVTAAGTGARRLERAPGGRPHTVTVRLTDAEYDTVTARAEALGISRQRLLVEAATARQVGGATDTGELALTVSERRALIAELLAVRRMVAALGTNVNQLARTANATGRLPDGLPATADAVQRALERLQEAVDNLAPRRRARAGRQPTVVDVVQDQDDEDERDGDDLVEDGRSDWERYEL